MLLEDFCESTLCDWNKTVKDHSGPVTSCDRDTDTRVYNALHWKAGAEAGGIKDRINTWETVE